MHTTFQLWMHPTNGQKRVYVNHTWFKVTGTKMYFFLNSVGQIDLKVFSDTYDPVHFKYQQGQHGAWDWVETEIGKENFMKIEALLK